MIFGNLSGLCAPASRSCLLSCSDTLGNSHGTDISARNLFYGLPNTKISALIKKVEMFSIGTITETLITIYLVNTRLPITLFERSLP